MNRDHSVVFEMYWRTAFWTLVYCDGYSISSKGFLPTVVDIMVIWVKFDHPVHYSSLIPKMSMFMLAISCLTTSNLPWFMDLTFQVPMQYCSLQHWTFLLSPVTSTAGYCFCFGSVSSFFLELFLHSSLVSIGHLPTWGVHLSVSYVFVWHCHFILSMGFSRYKYWGGLPFPSPVDHILSDLSIIIRPSWVAQYGMAHSFVELDKALVHVIRLVSFLCLWFSVCLLSDGEG